MTTRQTVRLPAEWEPQAPVDHLPCFMRIALGVDPVDYEHSVIIFFEEILVACEWRILKIAYLAGVVIPCPVIDFPLARYIHFGITETADIPSPPHLNCYQKFAGVL